MIHLIFIDLLKSEYFVIYFRALVCVPFNKLLTRLPFWGWNEPHSSPISSLSSFALFCFLFCDNFGCSAIEVRANKWTFRSYFFFLRKKFELIGVLLCENIWSIWLWLAHSQWMMSIGFLWYLNNVHFSRSESWAHTFQPDSFSNTIFGITNIKLGKMNPNQFVFHWMDFFQGTNTYITMCIWDEHKSPIKLLINPILNRSRVIILYLINRTFAYFKCKISNKINNIKF